MATVRVRKREDGSTYSQVRYRLDGVESSASFNDHAEALQFCDLANRLGPAKALDVWRVEQHHVAGMTVEQWINHYIDHLTGVAKSTIYDYRSYLRKTSRPALGAIPLAALTSDDIAEWVQDMVDDGGVGVFGHRGRSSSLSSPHDDVCLGARWVARGVVLGVAYTAP